MTEEQKVKKAAYDKKYYLENIEKKKAYEKSYSYANKEKKTAYSLKWAEENPEKRQAYLLKSKYGLDVNTFEEKVKNQNGVCAISKQVPSDKTLCIDHDHSCCPGKKSCGKCVRGLLHRQINTAMGLFQDNPEWLRAAADYIEFWKEEHARLAQ